MWTMLGSLILALVSIAGMVIAGVVLMLLGRRRKSASQFWLGLALFAASTTLVGWLIWRITMMV
jgi:hypothetical protein